MNNIIRAVIIIGLVAAVTAVISFKHAKKTELTQLSETPETSIAESNDVDLTVLPENDVPEPVVEKTEPEPKIEQTVKKPLPRLVDLGADRCIPCKMMAPILKQFKTEYAGVFEVEFIDVWKNPQAARGHGIRVIPTQIFYDSSGKELFRHEGFFGKEDMLAKWKEFGVELPKAK